MYVSDLRITKRQTQIIMGSILGGASIVKPAGGKNYYMSMRCKDLRWLQWKAAELREISTEHPIKSDDRTFRWRSLSYPLFAEMREKFYKDSRRYVDVDKISEIDSVGLAIWFADCGHIKDNRVFFNTHVFGRENTDRIKEYFTLCGWDSRVTTDRRCYRIQFSEESTKHIIKMMDPFLPIFKLEELYGHSKIDKEL